MLSYYLESAPLGTIQPSFHIKLDENTSRNGRGTSINS